MNIKLVSIDLAKKFFQVCGINQAGKAVVNKKVNRNKLLKTVLQLNPKKVVMESCYTVNYWGRKFQSHGFEVGAIPAQFVKAFVRGNKNDCNDALAIAEAAGRPNVKWVPIKTVGTKSRGHPKIFSILRRVLKIKIIVACRRHIAFGVLCISYWYFFYFIFF